MIDFKVAVPFISISIPIAIVGALLLALLKEQEIILKSAYAILMLVLCPIILRHTPARTNLKDQNTKQNFVKDRRHLRSITSRTGVTYTYCSPRSGLKGASITSGGAFLTGLLGVGIGEVIIPQLIKRHRIPVAAATSVYIVIVTIASASFTQVTALISAGGINAIPWNLVCYTVPAVIIGGQIGPWFKGSIAQRTMKNSIATLFGLIGLAMLWIVIV